MTGKSEIKTKLEAIGLTGTEADALIDEREAIYKATTIRKILAELDNLEGETC